MCSSELELTPHFSTSVPLVPISGNFTLAAWLRSVNFCSVWCEYERYHHGPLCCAVLQICLAGRDCNSPCVSHRSISGEAFMINQGMWSARNSQSAVLLICGWITIKMMKYLISYIISQRLVRPGGKRGVWVMWVLGRVQRQGETRVESECTVSQQN